MSHELANGFNLDDGRHRPAELVPFIRFWNAVLLQRVTAARMRKCPDYSTARYEIQNYCGLWKLGFELLGRQRPAPEVVERLLYPYRK